MSKKFQPTPMRAHNGYDTKEASDQACVSSDDTYWGPSLTIQSQAQDADINVIMERFGITGKMPENPRIPTYGDFTGINDFRTALEAVRSAQEGFMEIPAKVRAEFDNDPQKFLEFMADGNNLEKARALGLAKPLPPAPAIPLENTPLTPPPGGAKVEPPKGGTT